MRDTKVIIEELGTVKEYFENETGGAAPVCISEAMEFIGNEYRPDSEWVKHEIPNGWFWQCKRCGMLYPSSMPIEYSRWCPWCRSPMNGEKE